ncbi:hypothetical protein BDV39DRAFT_169508 [Aspergillus sergii]|uniref:Uncharacterized protein n=1 Tax=Aspergillus sergii TaxID=1034303 RepID=A0A5N6XEN9_9EURO|nr:hypothetical protein BDV39DRAFT_169508 [Aspergillus sergii]
MNNRFGYRGYEPELVRIELDFYRAFAELGLLRLLFLFFAFWYLRCTNSRFSFHFPFWEAIRGFLAI